MNKGTGTNIGANLIIVAFGTAVLAPIQYDQNVDDVPTYIAQYQNLPSNSWETAPVVSTIENQTDFDSLREFSENLLKNTKDIEPEILEVVNKNFWNLL